jgi:hypothetical protein
MNTPSRNSRYSIKLFLGIFAAIAFLAIVMESPRPRVKVVEELDVPDLEIGKRFSISPDLGSDLGDLNDQVKEVVSKSAREANAAMKQRTGANQSLRDSMKWIAQSMDSLEEKLDQISDNLENMQDKEIVEAEIKKAFREAFIGDFELGQTDEDSAKKAKTTPESRKVKSNNTAKARKGAQAKNNDKAVSDSAAAEIVGDPKEFEGLNTSEPSIGADVDLPVLGGNAPGWIHQRVIEEDRIVIPIESSMHATLEECRQELDEKLPEEVRKVLDSHVLNLAHSSEISELTSEYIRQALIDDSVEYDNYQERPSGNFHQLWVRLQIGKDEIDKIRAWERQVTTVSRVWTLAGFTLAFLGSFAGLSEVFKFLSKRERNRKHARQSV